MTTLLEVIFAGIVSERVARDIQGAGHRKQIIGEWPCRPINDTRQSSSAETKDLSRADWLRLNGDDPSGRGQEAGWQLGMGGARMHAIVDVVYSG